MNYQERKWQSVSRELVAGNILKTLYQLVCDFVGQNLKNYSKSFMVQKVENEENPKFSHTFGGECKADLRQP